MYGLIEFIQNKLIIVNLKQEGMLTRLCKWAREAMEPLRSYATGKLKLVIPQSCKTATTCEIKLVTRGQL